MKRVRESMNPGLWVAHCARKDDMIYVLGLYEPLSL